MESQASTLERRAAPERDQLVMLEEMLELLREMRALMTNTQQAIFEIRFHTKEIRRSLM